MKKFIVPLQAFGALFLCLGIAWMLFVLASINPVPPTASDLQARNTQELSFANMNSTAVALAKKMLVDMAPSPVGRIFLPVTGRETVAPTASAVVTLRPADTYVSTPTIRASITPTATRKKDETSVPLTYTFAPTKTSQPPTATNVHNTNPTTPTVPNTKSPTHTPVTSRTPIPPRPATPTSMPTEVKPTATSAPPTIPVGPTSTPGGTYP